MVIDFHTHTFPDSIAAKTIKVLEGNADIKAFTDGTLQGLKESMDGFIDLSVILPVVTKPSQFATINRFAALLNEKERDVISFGGMHPDTSDYKAELREIKALGLKGIKLHPAYQKTRIDDPAYMKIVDYASELGLVISVHAGIDIGLPDPVYCTPKHASALIKEVKPEKLVLAHMGGWKLWDEVEECLVGENVWFDTSFTHGYMGEHQMLSILRNHGTDKILFGSDSPWSGQEESLEAFCRLPLTEEERESILWRNAAKLLKLE